MSTRMAKINKTDNTKTLSLGKDMENWKFTHCWWECRMVNMFLSYNSAIKLLGIKEK